jgi:nitroimidazol reductase NimA-like FMN-containing flavoprotein (pyridoxamine 5'-phosphate oxidase superfamily)
MSQEQSAAVPSSDIPEPIRFLLTSQKLAVLATQNQGQPHASLVAFASTADAREIIFATTRSSRKFANLQADPRADLLIDSRTNQEADFHLGQALSAAGAVRELSGPDKSSRLQLFLTKHPHLLEFVQSPSCALMSLHVQVYNLVSTFQKVIEYRLPL